LHERSGADLGFVRNLDGGGGLVEWLQPSLAAQRVDPAFEVVVSWFWLELAPAHQLSPHEPTGDGHPFATLGCVVARARADHVDDVLGRTANSLVGLVANVDLLSKCELPFGGDPPRETVAVSRNPLVRVRAVAAQRQLAVEQCSSRCLISFGHRALGVRGLEQLRALAAIAQAWKGLRLGLER